MRKCEKCGADMIELFISWTCSDCKRNTLLTIPKEENTINSKSSQNHNRSGSYPAPTEEEIQQQKKKMLKALANFNTTAWRLIGQMNQLSIGIDNVTIAFKKLNDVIIPNITFAQDQLVNFDRWQTGIHSGVFDVYQYKIKPLYKIEPRHTINNLEEFSNMVSKDFGDCDKIRGQRVTQICMMDEYCNFDASIFDNIISSLKDGASYEEDKEDIDASKE